jgi:hypothetical protein
MSPGFEWMPTNPPRPAPVLMTATEAAEYLRLTEEGRDIGDALASLEYLVTSGRVRPCRVGRFNRFLRSELDRFMHEQTEQYSDRYNSASNRTGKRRVPTLEGGNHDHQG